MHPTNPECADLLSKKDSDLRKIIETRDIPCEDKTRNAAMRTAIWSYYGDDLQVNSVELDVTKGDAKPIWEKLQKYLPVYSLFQADRKNSDSDSEVQDPLHAAVKEILQDEGISQTLDHDILFEYLSSGYFVLDEYDNFANPKLVDAYIEFSEKFPEITNISLDMFVSLYQVKGYTSEEQSVELLRYRCCS